ncbi:MAG: hypothetical protein KF812_08840 [Fimbriimonadaceae bacterium]|nr:hypothetical protein [Fimbriimonadaceae bacterium]
MQILDSRVIRLERSLARQRMWNVAILLTLLAVGLVAFRQAPPRDIEARSFVLRNDEGKVVGYFGACATGSEFVLYGPEANTGLHLHGTDQGGQVQLYGPADKENIELLGHKDGGRVTLRNGSGEVVHQFPASGSD